MWGVLDVTMSGFWGGMRGLKVKELQPYVMKHAKDHWTPAKLVKNSKDFIHEYKVKHIDTGSAKPLFHTMAIVFFGSYVLAYPHVRTLPAVGSRAGLCLALCLGVEPG